MTTITDIGHAQFKLMMNNLKFRNEIIKSQEQMIKGLLAGLLLYNDNPEQEYFKTILELSQKYYLLVFEGDTILITRDFKAIIKFNIRQPNELHKKHFRHKYMIEIDNLNSIKKGHGRQFMNDVIELSKRTQLDLCLWTETFKNTQYFSKYGFVSKGRIGRNKENLMIKRYEVN